MLNFNSKHVNLLRYSFLLAFIAIAFGISHNTFAQGKPKATLFLRDSKLGNAGFSLSDTLNPDTCFIQFSSGDWQVSDRNIMLIRGNRPVQRARGKGNIIGLESFRKNAQDGDRILIEIKKICRVVDGKEGAPKSFTTMFTIPVKE